MGNLAIIVRGASPRPISDPKWFDDNSDVGWLRIADVTEQDGQICYLEQHISKLGQEKTRVLTEPHLLLSIAATVGKPVVNHVKTGVHDGFLIFLEPKFNRDFMFQWLEMFRPKWQKYGQPGSQVNLNSDLVKNQEIEIPSEKEQKKISLFFKQLDNTIALHQGKLNKLKSLKKAYLHILFPSKEEHIPKIRFTDFNYPWEQRKLEEIAKITMGQSPAGENYTENQNDHILVQGNADMKNGKVVPRIWTTQITKTATPDDIILSVRAPVGDVGKTDHSVVLGRGVAGVKGNEFIYQTLLRFKRIGFWTKYTTGSTFESINSQDLKKALINIPSEKEQFQIGEFLKKLDNTIALHQQKLNKLKELKKAYLNKMFV